MRHHFNELEKRAARSDGGMAKAGVKHDEGKLPWHLLPFDALRAIAKVLQFGAGKYAPRNWELGMDWDRPFAATLRHLTAWWERDEKDQETGFSHLWHASCCLLFLTAYELRGIGRDTRPSVLKQPQLDPVPHGIEPRREGHAQDRQEYLS